MPRPRKHPITLHEAEARCERLRRQVRRIAELGGPVGGRYARTMTALRQAERVLGDLLEARRTGPES